MSTYKRVSGNYVITTLGASDNVTVNTNTFVVNANTVLGNVDIANVTVETLSVGNVAVSGRANVVGNITTSNYFIGDGSFLSNVVAATSATDILRYSPFATSNVVATGNTSNVVVNVNGYRSATFTPDYIKADLKGSVYADDSSIIVDVFNNEINAGTAYFSGNVSGTYFLGNGRALTGVSTSAIELGTSNVDIGGTGNIAASVNGALVMTMTGSLVTFNTPVSTNGLTSSGLNTLTNDLDVTGDVNVVGNLDVNGNVSITGNLTYIDVSEVRIGDPLIFLAANNTTNTSDVGFVGNINPGIQQQTGFARDATDGTWKLFSNITSPINSTIPFANAVYDPIQVGLITSSGGTFSGNVTVANLNSNSQVTGTGLSVTGNANVGNLGATAGVFTGAVTGSTTLDITGNATVGNLSTAGLISTTGNIIATGNITGGNLKTTAVTIAASGAITGVTTINASGNANVGNIGATAGVFTGAITGSTTMNITGNITGGNLTTAGVLTVNTNAAATAIVNAAGNAVGNIGSSTGYFNTVFATSQQALYADLAEFYLADEPYGFGTVLMFGGSQEVTQCDHANSHRVAGVVSKDPAYLMNSGLNHSNGGHPVPLALTGRVMCQVRGPVEPGDILVSAANGWAMVNNNAQAGRILGKSLESRADDGMVEIVVGKH